MLHRYAELTESMPCFSIRKSRGTASKCSFSQPYDNGVPVYTNQVEDVVCGASQHLRASCIEVASHSPSSMTPVISLPRAHS